MSTLTELLKEWVVFGKDCLNGAKEWVEEKLSDLKDWCMEKWDEVTSTKMRKYLHQKMSQGSEWMKEVVSDTIAWAKDHKFWLIAGIILLVLGAATGVGFAAYGVSLVLAILYGLVAAGLGALATAIAAYMLNNRVREAEEITNTSQLNYKNVAQINVQTSEQLESTKKAKLQTDEENQILRRQIAIMLENLPPEQIEKAKALCQQAGVAMPERFTQPATASSAGLFSTTLPKMTPPLKLETLIASNEEESDDEEGEIEIRII
ncbi:hypothetical protein Lbir_2820 [Legionella birminghamensis]|uniref:Transmembrane protein n=1 Tax=Legionella birminghamensis TaxID=28083 RepID=A0A378I8X7_9GAMM|nr:SdpI family protein [Legionella birminghamensis]KTC68218.1 hypothetical protein Lbir_2820 [Legionella birminghamensis]STX31071.1 Uncharacterised protein [Legionella birminghamensis]